LEKRKEGGGGVFFGFKKLSHSSRMCSTFQVRVEKKGMTKAGALLLEAADTCLCLVFQTSKFSLLVFKCQEIFSQAPRSINQSIIPSYELHKTSFCFSVVFSVLLPLPSYGFCCCCCCCCYDFTTRYPPPALAPAALLQFL